MIKGILFDKDGTLLEFNSTMHHIYTDVLTCLKNRYQVPEPLLKQLKDTLGHLPDRLSSDSLLQFSTNPQIVDATLETSHKYEIEQNWKLTFDKKTVLELIEERSLDKNVPYAVLPHVPETLMYLQDKGYKLGIATADTQTATISGLKKTDILKYFDYLGTGDAPKPKPESLLADIFCRQCDIAHNELLIVGDSKNDMLFAENAGACFMGIDPAGNTHSIFKGTGYQSSVNINQVIDMFNL